MPSHPSRTDHGLCTLTRSPADSNGSASRAGPTGPLHDLRHLHATQLLAAGVPVRTVSGRLGHANAATTEPTRGPSGHWIQALPGTTG